MTTQTMLLAALALPACMLHTESRTDTTTIADRVEGVITNLDGADITVTGVRSSGAEVVQTLRWSAVEPAVSVRNINGILYIDARCPPEQLTCSVALDVTVPEAAWLDLSSGQGNITVSRVLSQLVAATGAGDITVQDTDGTVRLEAGKGSIDITGVTGDIDLYSGSGDIQGRQLSVGWLTAASDDGDIRIDTSTVPSRLGLFTEDGDVQAQVPAGAYAVDVNTGDGEIDISGITLQNASAQQIDIQTQSGDIRLYGH
jgi:hypothetical protein